MYSVLLVSNQILIRTALKKTIERNKNFYIKDEVNTPKEAIDLINKENINIVFSEFMMPSMNGKDFIDVVKKENKDIKVFLVTFPSDLFSREYKNIDLNQVILRPITYEKVEEKLKLYEKDYKNFNEINLVLEMQKEVNMNDFFAVYEYLTKYIDKYDFKNKEVENKVQIKNSLKSIANRIINLNNITDEAKKIEKEIPITNAIVSDSRLCKNWMFKILEYYFKRKSTINYPILENVLLYIDENIDKNISLSDVVKECNISQGYLSRLFKSEYNMTVVNFIHFKKINLAKEYIVLENQSISDVAFNLGYNEYGYFSKVFKKYEQETVEQFRKAR